jgi:mannosyl-oligosaccharide alpha-1,2-mannosidase
MITPRSPRRGRVIASGSNLTQLILLIVLAACLFIFGVAFGLRFLGPRGEDLSGADAPRPWESVTQRGGTRRLPPGVRGLGVRVVGADAAPPAAVGGAPAAAVPAKRLTPAFGAHPGGAPAPAAVAAPAAAAAPALAAVDTPLSFSPPAVWGDFSQSSRVELAGGEVDAPEVSGGAWIYLPSAGASGTINMVLTTRASGCATDDAHRGVALYVNNWETSDRALVLEWRESGGCGKLSSDAGTVPLDTWVHVGFALSSAGGGGGGAPSAMLFLGGRLLRVGASARAAGDVQAGRGEGRALWIGNSGEGEFPFRGRIAALFLARGVVTPAQLAASAALPDAAGWAAMAAAGEGKLLACVLLAGGEAAAGATVAAPLGLPPSAAAALRLAPGAPFLVVGDLARGGGAARGLGGLPSPEAAAAAAAAAAEAHRSAEAAAAELLPPADGVPRSRRAPKTAPAAVPAAIARGAVPGGAVPGAFDFSDGGNQWVRRMIRAPLSAASGSTSDPAALAAGTFSDEVTSAELAASDALGRTRASAVKAAMAHAWGNYKTRAWGSDELKPQSGRGENNWSGVGMTLVDSLDTLWVMGMVAEFREARDWVAAHLSFAAAGSISVFEVTIRVLGGLLAAFDLSAEPVFLEKARDLGDRLLPAFNTPTGIPRATVSLSSGAASNPGWTGGSSILSELGTLQVEFRYLSRATGNPTYARKVEAVMERMDGLHPAHGLFPIYVSADTGQFTTSTVAFGALGDSFYEYLVKVWVQGGRKEAMYRKMYDASMQGMTELLLKRSSPSRLAYIADWDGANTQDKMDHLVCFVPGMLALGAYNAAGTPGEANALRDLTNAKALAYTCWQMYERHATGIAPEFVVFPGGADLQASTSAPFYILRPEAAEALYVLHQLTGNPIYREWGWKMFQAIEKYCKTRFGYGAHPDVRDTSRTPDDRMERCVRLCARASHDRSPPPPPPPLFNQTQNSFFLAETLKYLYMLQSPDHPISLERYVFNTVRFSVAPTPPQNPNARLTQNPLPRVAQEAHPLSAWDSASIM